jgi:peptidoglycan DL-endopeptidase CwlO
MRISRTMFALAACCCMTAGLTASCGTDRQAPPVDNADTYVAHGATDTRLIDPAVTEGDELLKMGDANVEAAIGGGDSQELSSSHANRLRTMNAQQLVQVFPNPSIAPMSGSYAENAIAMASMYMGQPYEYGSDRSNPSTFDCSDFTRWSYLSGLGMDLPLDSRSQARYIKKFSNRVYYSTTEAKRGDLLFYIGYRGVKPENYAGADKSIDAISHVGIALGDGRMIHTASAATGGVRIDPVIGNHLQYRFVFGGSVLDAQ